LKTLTVIVLLTENVLAQSDDSLSNPVSGFEAAAQIYKNEKYPEAFERFNALAEKFPESGLYSSFRFMAAKSLFMAGDYKGAISLWTEYIIDFPGSTHLAEARLFLGHSYYNSGKIFEAASEYLAVVQTDPRSDCARYARENLTPLIRRGLKISVLQQLISENPDSPLIEQMEFALARRQVESGHRRQGINSLKSFIKRYPGSKEFKQAKTLLEETLARAEEQLEIGILAPISGNYREYGRTMIEAANLAIRDLTEGKPQFELSIQDTEGNAIRASKVARDIVREEPVAVIGPLRSEEAVTAALVLDNSGVPMITPTASETGLSDIGPNIFQVSSPIENIGKAIANYAVSVLDIREFAIIAPDDVGGARIANAFAKTAYELGAEVVFTVYYSPGMSDFKQQIMPLREILLVKTENQLLAGQIDSSEFLDPKTTEFWPPEEWSVELGGLFLPGYPADLKQLIPQVKYHIIRTRFLGGDGWDSDDLLREVRPYVNDAIFATDFHSLSDDPAWRQFVESFSSAYNHSPDKVAALTYDAVGLVVTGLLAGNKNPDDMRHYLSQVENYRGVSGVITFKGSGRANNGVAIYSVSGQRLAGAK
jgi:ABC-type branched-subunit amino acid transport system substrate-binding protein